MKLTRIRPLVLAVAAAALTSTAMAGEAPLACDLLFAGGKVVDGTGAPWFRADVCVVGDRIAAVGLLPQATAHRRIDASGLVVAPGFIDMMGQSEYNLLVDNRAASKITQGITTEITGEGSSIGPRTSTSATRPPSRRWRATSRSWNATAAPSTWGPSWARAACATW